LGHRYHIHSISLNSDGEHFLSSDEFRITLWNLNISNEGFSTVFNPIHSPSLELFVMFVFGFCEGVVDTTPETLESLREVITAAEFHPQHCNIFVYSTSRGNLYCADMRQRSLCDQTSKVSH
jgi:serine/threonine-protein phosphatase 2A regulatory subunit B